ncbi:MAG: DNA polymerase II [Myxococcota bacterium]
MQKGVILQPTYRTRNGVPVIQLYGRLESGEPFLIEDDRFRPYFFVRTQDLPRLETDLATRFQETELADLDGEQVSRITLPLPSAVRPLRDQLVGLGVRTYEADILFSYRYLMDHAIRVSVGIEGKPRSSGSDLVRFHNPDLTSTDVEVDLTYLSLDLETTPDASSVYSAGLAGCGTEEVLLVYSSDVNGAKTYSNEKDLLIALASRIRELDPDVIVGWNIAGFDLDVLARRFEALGLSAKEGALGRTLGRIDIQQSQNFLRPARASIPGRMVLDGIPLVRDALKLPDYKLGTVAHEVLGRGKLIDEEAPDAAAEITRLYQEEPEALVAYNLEDARLVLEILEHEDLLALTRERGRLSGMQLDRVAASIASFDMIYLPELRRHGAVAPSVDPERISGPVKGGFVLDPTPGLARNVAVYDFKSLYPSLMRTFNIDPLALARGRHERPGAAIVAPNGAHLSREDAILSHVLERMMRSREEAKARGDRHASQAIKIMMNSMFGIFAAPSCRFFSPDLANAITSFGQQTLAWTCEAFAAEGVSVIYGDTDSVFVQLPDGEADQAGSLAEEMRVRVASLISNRIQDEYDVEAQLELELEKIFTRFFLPRVRGGSGGSKKRYAGWVSDGEEERLEIVGLESVRRDWPAVARRLQEGMLTRLFQDEAIMPFASEIVQRVRNGSLDPELVYAKRIRKGSLDRYTASSPPHIQAARKFEERSGHTIKGVIRYVITARGPEPVLPGEPLPTDIDRSHYLERVLRPVAESILSEQGLSFSEALGEGQQMSLL